MAKDFNHPKVVEHYDHHIRQLIPGYELVHLQLQAILKTRLQDNAKILIVGCGTGYELSYLLEQFPKASFVAIDPSLEMLEKAKKNIHNQTQLERIEFLHVDTSGLTSFQSYFDVALSILVAHFVPSEEKQTFINDIAQSLQNCGICIHFDLMRMSDEVEKLELKYLTESLGLAEAQSTAMLARMQDDFYLISPSELEALYRNAGFDKSKIFTQILNFYGFIATK